MRKTLTVVACVCALAIPAGNVWAATRVAASQQKRVVTVTKSATSSVVGVDRWGELELKINVAITTTTVGSKKTKTWKVTSVTWPVYPQHTDRSAYISSQALPLLRQEILALKGNQIQIISGATDTTYAFLQALKGALSQAGAI